MNKDRPSLVRQREKINTDIPSEICKDKDTYEDIFLSVGLSVPPCLGLSASPSTIFVIYLSIKPIKLKIHENLNIFLENVPVM